MAVKPSENTKIVKRFQAALAVRIQKIWKTQINAAQELGFSSGALNNILHKAASAAIMEEIANKLGLDLIDMLIEGRAIIGEDKVYQNESPDVSTVKTTEADMGNQDWEHKYHALLEKYNDLLEKYSAVLERTSEVHDRPGETSRAGNAPDAPWLKNTAG